MPLIQAEQFIRGTSSGFEVAGPWVLVVVAGSLIGFHLLRALAVDDGSATRWLAARSLEESPRAIAETRAHLRRLRVTRAWGAVLFLALSGLAAAFFQLPIGVLSAPYLIAVLGAELLAPRPRQGRTRTASLLRRPADFFAPRLAVRAARLLFLLAVSLSTAALVLGHGPGQAKAALHLGLLLLGAATFESCLRVISRRGLPAATEDLRRDSALRVASSRSCTAAALTFSGAGALYAAALLVRTQPDAWSGRIVLNQVGGWCVMALLVAVIRVAQPVFSWQPRTR